LSPEALFRQGIRKVRLPTPPRHPPGAPPEAQPLGRPITSPSANRGQSAQTERSAAFRGQTEKNRELGTARGGQTAQFASPLILCPRQRPAPPATSEPNRLTPARTDGYFLKECAFTGEGCPPFRCGNCRRRCVGPPRAAHFGLRASVPSTAGCWAGARSQEFSRLKSGARYKGPAGFCSHLSGLLPDGNADEPEADALSAVVVVEVRGSVRGPGRRPAPVGGVVPTAAPEAP
jgi:hypothetical protein